MNFDWRRRPALLCVAHPGHELRVFGWLGQAKPEVFVLTDGSGRSGESRVGFTAEVLAACGARPGSFFGRLADADAYAAIMAVRPAPFLAAVEELCAALERCDGGYVVGDAAEGYNATHDVCRMVINAAVSKARRRGVSLASFEFPLVGPPSECPVERRSGAIEVRLSPAELDRKLAAARRCADLGVDVDEALRRHGREAFALELLRPEPFAGPGDGLDDAMPFYEVRGEQQVRAGKYAQVLRRREHVLPLAASLWRAAEEDAA